MRLRFMHTEQLERHIIDTIKEWQMKIGYKEENMRLYYPDVSLIGMLELPDGTTEKELKKNLAIFAEIVSERLGQIEISNVGDRYCLNVPPEGCKYISEKIPDSELLKNLLVVLDRRENDMDQVRKVFQDYATEHQGICVEEDHENEGLGLVFYYTSEETDPYVYCMEQDDFGITYHRFSRSDYNKLVSKDNEIKHNAQECIMCK